MLRKVNQENYNNKNINEHRIGAGTVNFVNVSTGEISSLTFCI
jgi:hypothetical protein